MASAENSVFKDQLPFFRFEFVARNLLGPQKQTISSANLSLRNAKQPIPWRLKLLRPREGIVEMSVDLGGLDE
jgi:hypothetical protein